MFRVKYIFINVQLLPPPFLSIVEYVSFWRGEGGGSLKYTFLIHCLSTLYSKLSVLLHNYQPYVQFTVYIASAAASLIFIFR